MDGVALGAQLSPVTASFFFIEDWADVTQQGGIQVHFLVLLCGWHFLNHLDNIHPNIQFTKETFVEWTPFLPGHRHIQKTKWLLGAHCIWETHLYQPVCECWVTPPHGLQAFCVYLCTLS